MESVHNWNVLERRRRKKNWTRPFTAGAVRCTCACAANAAAREFANLNEEMAHLVFFATGH